jgi:hypothetical protein
MVVPDTGMQGSAAACLMLLHYMPFQTADAGLSRSTGCLCNMTTLLSVLLTI